LASSLFVVLTLELLQLNELLIPPCLQVACHGPVLGFARVVLAFGTLCVVARAL
jgi:hypothetical protein